MKKAILFFSVLTSFSSFAQWTENYAENTLVSNSDTSDIQSIGTNDGKTYIVYWQGPTDNYVLKAQLLDAQGNQLFGADGMIINNTADISTYTVTSDQAVDEDGNLFISFTATQSTNGYVHKISPEGEQLWGAEGIDLGADSYDTKLLPTNDGGAIVGRSHANRGTLQKFDESGNPIWAEPVLVNVNDSNTTVGEMAMLSDGSFVVIAHSRGNGTSSTLWAQRYSADGVEMWDNAVQLSENTTAWNRRYELSQDGDVVFLGYFSAANNRFDSYLQRINPDGTIPWGMNGAAFRTTDDSFEGATSIAMQEGSEYIWAIAQFSDTTQGLLGEYVQKFNKETGERMFTDEAKEIFPLNTDSFTHKGKLQLVNDMPLFLFSTGFNNGASPIQLAVTYLDENGDFAWEDDYKTIATTATSKGRIDFSKNVEGQSVATWTEEREAGISRAYAQNFIVEPTMGVSDLNTVNVAYYPNPVKSTLNISSKKSIKNIYLSNMAGQVVMKTAAPSNGQVNVSALAPGVYVAKVILEDGKIETFKIIKK